MRGWEGQYHRARVSGGLRQHDRRLVSAGRLPGHQPWRHGDRGGQLGQGDWHRDTRQRQSLGQSEFIEGFSFTVSVPGGLPRYGIQVGQNWGTVWESASEMQKGPALTLGSLSG